MNEKEILDVLRKFDNSSLDKEERENNLKQLSNLFDQITEIDLMQSEISNEGAKAIAKVIETNTTLTKLTLRSNQSSNEGAKAIIKALETNTTLTTFNLKSPSIGFEARVEKDKYIGRNVSLYFAKRIRENDPTLTELDLHGQRIGDDGAKIIAKDLGTNTTLESIDFNNCNISDEGAIAIVKALEKNITLKYVNFEHNQISNEGAEVIFEDLLTNKTLLGFHTSYNQIKTPSFGRHYGMRIDEIIDENKKHAENFAVANELQNAFKNDKKPSIATLESLKPRISAVLQILRKKDALEAFNTVELLKKFLTQEFKFFIEDGMKQLNSDVIKHIFDDTKISTFINDKNLIVPKEPIVTEDMINIAMIKETALRIKILSEKLEEKLFPKDWKVSGEVLKGAIDVFLSKGKTDKFDNFEARVNFLEKNEIEKHPDYKKELKSLIEKKMAKEETPSFVLEPKKEGTLKLTEDSKYSSIK